MNIPFLARLKMIRVSHISILNNTRFNSTTPPQLTWAGEKHSSSDPYAFENGPASFTICLMDAVMWKSYVSAYTFCRWPPRLTILSDRHLLLQTMHWGGLVPKRILLVYYFNRYTEGCLIECNKRLKQRRVQIAAGALSKAPLIRYQ